MKRVVAKLLAIGLVIALSGCGGGSAPDDLFNPSPGPGLSGLDFDLVTRASSSVDSSEVTGNRVDLTHPNYQSADDNLPAGYHSVFGILLEPDTAPGDGFDGNLTVRPAGHASSALFTSGSGRIFYVDDDGDAWPAGHVTENGSGDLNVADLSALGLLIFAESGGGSSSFSVSAFADLSQAQAGTEVNFWAIAHNGTDPIDYQWTFGDGASASGETVAHTYAVGGIYNVSLVATDASGDTAPTASTPIEITDTPNPLTSVTAPDPTPAGSPLTFTFSATVQGGDPPLTYSWDFDGDGTEDSSAGPPVDFTFPGGGFYEGSVTVTDSLGNSASDDFNTDARSFNISADPLSGFTPLTVSFSIDDSSAGSGSSFHIDFGDGNSVDNPVSPFTHDYTSEGTYLVSATATRSADGTDYVINSNELEISVTDAPPLPPKSFLQLTQPISGQAGAAGAASFTIHGFDFGATQGTAKLMLDGSEIPVDSWSDTAISFSPPGGVDSGNLTVENAAGSSNFLHIDFTPGLPPSVQNILPLDNTAPNRILIVGHGFGSNPGTADINGVPMVVEEWCDNGVLATLPLGLADGELAVQVNIPTGETPGFSTVLGPDFPAGPTINSIGPFSEFGGGPAVLIGGGGFGDGVGGIVFCDGVLIPAVSWTDSLITLGDAPKSVETWCVVINRDRVSNANVITDISRPHIDSINPADAYAGLSIDIQGQFFGRKTNNSVVLLGTTALTINTWTDTLINVTLPVGVSDNNVVVRNKLDSNLVPLNIIPAPPSKPDLGQI